MENPTMSDFQIADHGSIISIKPVSEAARTWVEENVVSEPWQWLGGALPVSVPPRHAPSAHRSSGIESVLPAEGKKECQPLWSPTILCKRS
jgi:hypothetical protein